MNRTLAKAPQDPDDEISDLASSLESTEELSVLVGSNLRRLRTKRGHSLERLAKLSGVSRAMLGQIETAKSIPSIGVLWKVANALKVPFAALIATTRPT